MTYSTVYCPTPRFVTLHNLKLGEMWRLLATGTRIQHKRKGGSRKKGTWSASRPTPASRTRPGLFRSVSERNLLEQTPVEKADIVRKCGKTDTERVGGPARPGACMPRCLYPPNDDGTTDAATEEGNKHPTPTASTTTPHHTFAYYLWPCLTHRPVALPASPHPPAELLTC